MTTLTAEQIKREISKLETRSRKRVLAYRDDQETIERLRRQLHRLELKALLKVEGAVKLECRRPAGTQLAHLNDLTATITRIRRTRMNVVFSNEEKWEFAIEDVAAADAEQGFMHLP